MEELQAKWKHLYATQLPSMARTKDSKQKHWPVHVDHCFGRIVLDNAVGKDRPWMEVVKSPAIKHMTESQIKAAIEMGEQIVSGEADLDELNERSLSLRGKAGPASRKRKSGVAVDSEAGAKKQKVDAEEHEDSNAESKHRPSESKTTSSRNAEPKSSKEEEPDSESNEQNLTSKKSNSSTADQKKPTAKKTKAENGNLSTYFLPSPKSPQRQERQATKQEPSEKNDLASSAFDKAKAASDTDMGVQLKRIADSKLTSFRKQTLSMLCQIPRGRYSTYQAMSDYITKHSHKTCARAVGNAMRNNPFAPEVPCHRILAADGSLGGFGGHWGEDGKFANLKHQLLDQEGVKFDSRGKVKGPPFREFSAVGG